MFINSSRNLNNYRHNLKIIKEEVNPLRLLIYFYVKQLFKQK